MTLSETGGYIRLLCSQWAKGSVPGDNLKKLAAIMRCTPATAKSVWEAIRGKFDRGNDGGWRNQKLEDVRYEQAEYRAGKSRSGKAGAEKRWQKDGTAIAQPSVRQWQNDGSSSSSSSSSSKERTVDPDPKIPDGPRGYDRQHADHVMEFCAFKCLSDRKIAEFAKDLPGDQDEPKYQQVLTWARSVRDGWPYDRVKAPAEWWLFWKDRWNEHIGGAHQPLSKTALTRAAFQRASERRES